MAGNENRSSVTEDHGREPVQTQSKKKCDQSKSREGSSWERIMEDMGERLEIVEHNVKTLEGHILEQLDFLKKNAKVMDALQAMQIGIEILREDLAVCKKTATTVGASTSVVSPRVDYHKPNRFDGQRDAKKVENFLWQIERYFEGLNLTDKASRVRTTSLYLTDTAILWWHRKHTDIERGSYRVDTWEDFKKELKRYFYLENVVYEARKEYVKDFTTIMLQIPNLLEEDLLFHFVDDVKSVDEAIAIAESLIEYQPHTNTSKKKKKWNPTKGGGEKRDNRDQRKTYPPKGGDMNPSWKEYEEKKRVFIPKRECFVCKGPHAMSNYPKLRSLSAMVERNEATATIDEGMLPATSNKGLIYVEAYISGKPTKALVDTKATHNFITEEKANRLGLRWSRGEGWLKTVNAKAQPLNGVVKNMELCLGTWNGQVDFSVAPIDDFKVILSMDFLRKVTTISMPSYSSVCILEKGAPWVKRGEPTYLATLKKEVSVVAKEEDLATIIQNVLEENKDMMPDELPKKLPSRREVDHKIELELGTKPPTMARDGSDLRRHHTTHRCCSIKSTMGH
ncbi:hypothetical protein Pfo_021845 [Paulownia fortunei]|nr:hypothetical protein Pfo_021845 [Paulownia fortunei]